MAVASTVRVAALFSGGKDSTYAAYAAVQRGWELTHLLSILPEDRESMLFHVPNLHMTALLAEAMQRPLISEEADKGEEGELDALRRIFRRVDVDGIVVGAIASDYQHERVNRVAEETGLRVFAPFGDTIRGDSSAITSRPVSTSSSPASRPKALTRVGSVAVGMQRRSRTSSAWSEPAACIRAARAESSRPWCSTGLSSISGSKSFEPNRNGREPRACGVSSTRTSSRNRDRSPPPGLRDRPEVLEELGPLIGLREDR